MHDGVVDEVVPAHTHDVEELQEALVDEPLEERALELLLLLQARVQLQDLALGVQVEAEGEVAE